MTLIINQRIDVVFVSQTTLPLIGVEITALQVASLRMPLVIRISFAYGRVISAQIYAIWT
jgi:hypothetical protein